MCTNCRVHPGPLRALLSLGVHTSADPDLVQMNAGVASGATQEHLASTRELPPAPGCVSGTLLWFLFSRMCLGHGEMILSPSLAHQKQNVFAPFLPMLMNLLPVWEELEGPQPRACSLTPVLLGSHFLLSSDSWFAVALKTLNTDFFKKTFFSSIK